MMIKQLKRIAKGRIIALLLAAAAVLSVSSSAFALSQINAYMLGPLGGANTTVRNSDGTTALPVGYVLQYIYAGADNTPNTPTALGATTGDDVLISTVAVGDNTATPGTFSHVLSGLTASARIYIRAWNGASIGASTFYGDSATFVLSVQPPNPPDAWEVPNFSTTTVKPGSTASFVSATPSSAYSGNTLNVVIVGLNTNFLAGVTTASFGAGITVNLPVTVTDPTHCTVNIAIPAGTSAGPRNVVITTGAEVITGTNAFTVNAPSVALAPNNGLQGTTVTVTLTGTGTHFLGGTTTATVSGANVTAGVVTVTSATTATVNLTIGAGAAIGGRTLTLTTALGGALGTETVANTFTVTALGGPTVTAVNPNTGVNTTTTPITITGTNFTGVTAVNLGGTALVFTYVSPTQITATVPASLAPGAYHVTVTTPSGTSPTSPADLFTVTAPAAGLIIDDFETHAGFDPKGWMDGYFQSGAGVDEVTVPAPVNNIATLHEGARSMQARYPGSVGTQWGGYWGGYLTVANKDATPYNGVSFWMRGDGSTNTVRLAFKEANAGGAAEESYQSPSIPMSDTTWHEVRIPFSNFTRDPSGYIGAGADGNFSRYIRSYTFVYAGSAAVATDHYIDYIVATNITAATPAILSITPNSGNQGAALTVTVVGSNTNFVNGTTTLSLGAGITIGTVTVTDATHLTATITIDPAAALGARDVTVTTGAETATLAGGFTVTTPGGPGSLVPTVTSVTPNSGINTTTTPVVINGTNLTGATAVRIGTFDVTSFTVISATEIHAVIPSGLTPGAYHVTVTTPYGTSASTTMDVFTVVGPGGPAIDGIPFNYPNPFNPISEVTHIAFTISTNTNVTVYIFDPTGRIVSKKEQMVTAGYNEIIWDGKDDFGNIAGNGVYPTRLTVDGRLFGKIKIWIVKR